MDLSCLDFQAEVTRAQFIVDWVAQELQFRLINQDGQNFQSHQNHTDALAFKNQKDVKFYKLFKKL